MQVLVLNAIGGRLDQLHKVLDKVRAADVGAVFVLGSMLAGSDSSSPTAEGYAPVLDMLGSLHIPVYLVPSTGDAPLQELSQIVNPYCSPSGLHLLHRSTAYLGNGTVVAGFGGQLSAEVEALPERWRFRDWEARVAFEHLAAFNASYQMAERRLLLFAAPLYDDHESHAGEPYAGTRVITTVIRSQQPHLVCCGGQAASQVTKIDGTPVLNPGTVAEGCYALIDLESLQVRLERLHEPLPGDAGVAHAILVALDGSAESWRALEMAAGLARRSKATLTLLHAFEHVNAVLGRPYENKAVAQRVLHGEKLLAEAAEYVADLQPQLELIEGPAVDAIVRVAETQHIDLIVMGARSHGGLRTLLGSVSRRVLRRAPCSVLITHQRPDSAMLAEHRAVSGRAASAE